MRDVYSLYEAKAKLSAIIRRVREGQSVVLTLHGKPVAEIRPIDEGEGDVAGRLEHLVERGIVFPAKPSGSTLRPIVRKSGALARFLAERDG